MNIRKVVIPAAGLGSRFYPLTRGQPKEMLPILDKPVIHYVVEEAVKSGLDEILIIVGKGKEAIINYFDSNQLENSNGDEYGLDDFPEIFFVRQRHQSGLGDAVRYAEKFVNNEPFAVLLGDTIYTTQHKETVTQQLMRVFEKRKTPTIGVEQVSKEKIKDYGIIKGKEIEKDLWKIEDMVEKPKIEEAPSNMGVTGNYILTPKIFEYIKRIKPGKNNEYQLTDALKLMCANEELFGYKFSGKRYDIGTKALWIKTFTEFAKNDKRFSENI